VLKWLGIIVAVIAGVGIAVYAAGSVMPQSHSASRTVRLSQLKASYGLDAEHPLMHIYMAPPRPAGRGRSTVTT
jgi:hypothetical protein